MLQAPESMDGTPNKRDSEYLDGCGQCEWLFFTTLSRSPIRYLSQGNPVDDEV